MEVQLFTFTGSLVTRVTVPPHFVKAPDIIHWCGRAFVNRNGTYYEAVIFVSDGAVRA